MTSSQSVTRLPDEKESFSVDASEGPEQASAPSNAARAYNEIKQRILDNVYPVGATGSVQELADALGISRTPIRDALIRLEEERLVALSPRHGFRVLPISAAEMIEIYQIVGALELLAIELLIGRRLEPQVFTPLEAAVTAMEAALDSGDRDAWAQSDARFHQLIIALSGSTRLAQTVRQFLDQTRRVRDLTLHLRPAPEQSTKSHRALLTAIVAGDAPAARELHHAQRQRSGTELAHILQKLNIRHL